MQRKLFHTLFLIFCLFRIEAQQYSILIKGGHVIDPKNNIDGILDVAISNDTIARIDVNIDPQQARQVINASGFYITPGLIDIHSHNFFGTNPDHYLSNGMEALPPDGFTFRNGVTTVVDAGSAGWRNFSIFKSQTIDHSKTRVLSFLNIVGHGMRGKGFEQNLDDMDAEKTAEIAQQHKEIVGIKVAHYYGPGWDPVDRAVEAGKLANIPVMVDFGGRFPPLSLDDLLLKHLRKGDIFTHTFANIKGRIPIVGYNGKVHPYVWEAQRKGIVFDVGHGGGSFMFMQAIPAMRSGFFPNTISTDIHAKSMNEGMKDLLNVMSKCLVIGMPLNEVINSVTWRPAQVIQRPELGHLSPGAVADLAILSLREGKFGFVDSGGYRFDGDRKFECELTVRQGKIVYDLNGISRPDWVIIEKDSLPTR